MHILIEDKIYEPITVFDYQAVCYEDRETDYDHLMKRNSAMRALLWNPFKYVLAALTTLLSTVYALPSYMANCKYLIEEFTTVFECFFRFVAELFPIVVNHFHLPLHSNVSR